MVTYYLAFFSSVAGSLPEASLSLTLPAVPCSEEGVTLILNSAPCSGIIDPEMNRKRTLKERGKNQKLDVVGAVQRAHWIKPGGEISRQRERSREHLKPLCRWGTGSSPAVTSCQIISSNFLILRVNLISGDLNSPTSSLYKSYSSVVNTGFLVLE